jgi:hypothetical protein
LAKRIHRLLGQDGYTVLGVQKLLAEKRESEAAATPAPPPIAAPTPAIQHGGVSVSQLTALRDRLREALGA